MTIPVIILDSKPDCKGGVRNTHIPIDKKSNIDIYLAHTTHTHIMRRYYLLGQLLKSYRENISKTISQVSIDIDIDRSYLSKLENGHERPSQSTLNKLIAYYNIGQQHSTLLYATAGYINSNFADFTINNETFPSESDRKEVKTEMKNENNNDVNPGTGPQVLVPQDVKVLYSDSAWVTPSAFGIVLDFAQVMGPTNQHTVVSRIGMSTEHAEALINVIAEKLKEVKLIKQSKQKKRDN